MAIFYACDACGYAMKEGPALTAGLVVVRQYCETCAPSVKLYEADRNQLHKDVAEEWAKKSTQIRDDWLEAHPDGQLPDML